MVTTAPSDGVVRSAEPATGEPGEPRLRVRRRRALPNGRAVVGGFLVTVAAVSAFAVASRTGDGPSRRYVVAARDVAIGTTLTPPDLALMPAELPEGAAERAYAEVTAAAGRVTVAPLRAGDLVRGPALVGAAEVAPAAHLSVPISRSHAFGGAVDPGERLDVVATYGPGGGQTAVVAHAARVIRVDAADGAPLAGSDALVLVVSVDPDEALVLADAAQNAKLSLVRPVGTATGSASDGPRGASTTASDTDAGSDGLGPSEG
ncbi:MAG: RcpC/CpaB family pilus assembly protein [Acidimicrobiia bacterium]